MRFADHPPILQDSAVSASPSTLILGDVAIGSADVAAIPQPLGQLVAAIPEGFAERFARVAAAFGRSTARVRRLERRVDRTPGRPWTPERIHAEERHDRAMVRHLALEDQLSALIRSLSGGLPVLADPDAEPTQENRRFAAVEWRGVIYTLDSSGTWVTARPPVPVFKIG